MDSVQKCYLINYNKIYKLMTKFRVTLVLLVSLYSANNNNLYDSSNATDILLEINLFMLTNTAWTKNHQGFWIINYFFKIILLKKFQLIL